MAAAVREGDCDQVPVAVGGGEVDGAAGPAGLDVERHRLAAVQRGPDQCGRGVGVAGRQQAFQRHGDVVGITIGVMSSTAKGIGFAIPSKVAQRVVGAILDDTTVDSGYVGIATADAAGIPRRLSRAPHFGSERLCRGIDVHRLRLLEQQVEHCAVDEDEDHLEVEHRRDDHVLVVAAKDKVEAVEARRVELHPDRMQALATPSRSI